MPLLPSLLVPGTAEEMAEYYVDVFPDGEITDIFRAPGPDGSEQVVTANVRIRETDILVVNGGDENARFNEAFSLTISCVDQDEVDHFWDRFVGDGGFEIDCGWCADKFGVRWQVIPAEMPGLLQHPEPARAQAAMEAMMTMKKIDLNVMKQAMGLETEREDE